MSSSSLRLVRVVAPHFVAGFETDGIVRRAAPILRRDLMGLTDTEASNLIRRKGWKARVITKCYSDKIETSRK
jgi:hypothetical protein